jgi:hypothetical protein
MSRFLAMWKEMFHRHLTTSQIAAKEKKNQDSVEMWEGFRGNFFKGGTFLGKKRTKQQKKETYGFEKRSEDKTEWRIVYPDDDPQEEIHNQIHPTICLSDYREHPEGLLLYEGYEEFSNIRLEKRTLQIGHSEDSDIVIAKDTISRYHARIECADLEFFLEDLNSTNGTFVNEKQLAYKEKRKLKTNDIIRFADVKYRFV